MQSAGEVGIVEPNPLVAAKVRPTGSQNEKSTHRSVFDELGWFSENLRTGEFFNLLSRLPDQNIRTSFLKVLGVERRIHGSNLTYEIDALSENMLRSLRHRIEQRRRS